MGEKTRNGDPCSSELADVPVLREQVCVALVLGVVASELS